MLKNNIEKIIINDNYLTFLVGDTKIWVPFKSIKFFEVREDCLKIFYHNEWVKSYEAEKNKEFWKKYQAWLDKH